MSYICNILKEVQVFITRSRLLATVIRRHWTNRIINNTNSVKVVGRDSSVGIATRYGLDGPGIESKADRADPCGRAV